MRFCDSCHDHRTHRGEASDRVRLERIPLEVLFLLVEHPGEIVTREEIVARVWGNGVFLDTDNSIRGAIRKIRQALKDNPEQPRFIQTLTGRGYRFIAPVVAIGFFPEETIMLFGTAISRSTRFLTAIDQMPALESFSSARAYPDSTRRH